MRTEFRRLVLVIVCVEVAILLSTVWFASAGEPDALYVGIPAGNESSGIIHVLS